MSEDTKVCPFCAETIKAAAIKCRFCGESLTPLDVSKPAEVEITTAPAPKSVAGLDSEPSPTAKALPKKKLEPGKAIAFGIIIVWLVGGWLGISGYLAVWGIVVNTFGLAGVVAYFINPSTRKFVTKIIKAEGRKGRSITIVGSLSLAFVLGEVGSIGVVWSNYQTDLFEKQARLSAEEKGKERTERTKQFNDLLSKGKQQLEIGQYKSAVVSFDSALQIKGHDGKKNEAIKLRAASRIMMSPDEVTPRYLESKISKMKDKNINEAIMNNRVPANLLTGHNAADKKIRSAAHSILETEINKRNEKRRQEAVGVGARASKELRDIWEQFKKHEKAESYQKALDKCGDLELRIKRIQDAMKWGYSPDKYSLDIINIYEKRKQSVKDKKNAAELASKMKELGLTWQYYDYSDKMSGESVKKAYVDSVNQVEFGFPYQGIQRATLTLRRHPKYGNDAILTVQKGQFLCNSYDGCSVYVRFDKGKAVAYDAAGPSDHGTTTLFVRNYSTFVRNLKNAKEVYIQAEFYKEGSRVFEFYVDGLEW